jgi:hypothetical protein
MHVLTTAGDQRIYISTNIECVLKPQKLVRKNIIIYKYELSDFVILAFLTPNLSNDVTLTSLGIDHRCFDTLGKETYGVL